MKNFYKEIIVAVLLVLAYFFILPPLLGWYFAPEKLTVSKPQTTSVMLNDGRSLCDKQADIRINQEWEARCAELKFAKQCPLSPEDAKKFSTQKDFIVSQCP